MTGCATKAVDAWRKFIAVFALAAILRWPSATSPSYAVANCFAAGIVAAAFTSWTLELNRKPLRMTAPLNLIGPQVRKFRNRKKWTQEALAAKLRVEGWNVSRESLAKLEAQFRRAPDCELLFLAKALGVEVIRLFPAKLDLKMLDPSLRLKVSTKHPRRKSRRVRGT